MPASAARLAGVRERKLLPIATRWIPLALVFGLIVSLAAHDGLLIRQFAATRSSVLGPQGLPSDPLDASFEDKRWAVMRDRMAIIRFVEANTEPDAVVAFPTSSEGLALTEIGFLYLHPRILLQSAPDRAAAAGARYVVVIDGASLRDLEPIVSDGASIRIYALRE